MTPRRVWNARTRWSLVAIAVAAAAALSISAGIGRWWSIGNEFEIGPFGARQCTDGECRPANLPLGGGPRWERLAVASGAACLIASFLLLLVAAGLAAGRAPKLIGKTGIVAAATAALAGGLFVATAPSMLDTLDRGFYLYAVGVVLAFVATIGAVRSTATRE